MWIFFPLLCILCAAPIHSFFEGTCPRKDPSPGVLVLSTGRELVLTCRGRVIVDGAEVRNSSSTNKRDSSSGTSQTTVNVINTTGVLMQSGINQGNHTSPKAAEENRSRGHTVSPTTHVDQPTNVQRQLNAKVGDGESVFNEEEEEWDEGSRVTRGIKSRPQWKWTGRMERKGQRDIKWMIGDELFLSSVRLTDSGVYTCYYRGRDRFSLKVIVTDPPEKPSLFCYKKSPSSKIRCESNPQESVAIRPNCYLLLSKSPKEAFHPIQCSYSSRLSRCWCTLDHNEDEMRAGHFASLCVTSIAGNVTSNLLDFTPMGILKPDPPSNVSIRQVEGQETRLKVTWNLPSSWKSHDNFYDLIYELKYRPVMSSFHYEQVNGIKDVRSFLITDAIPGVEYQIQLRTKEEYDGVWSNWSTPVFASSWTAPETTTIMISDYVDTEGSGTDISTVDVPPTFTTVSTDVWGLSTHVLWISGFFVLFSVFLALYIFRHKDRFLSKLQNLSFVPECGDSPRPLPSVPPAPEGQALMTLCPPSYKERLEGEEENEEQSPNERIEAMHFSNTSYFCVQQ